MSLQKCAPVKFESLEFFGQEKLVRVIECSSYQKLVYNLPVHVVFLFFFERDQFVKKLILRPSQIKKLLRPTQIKKLLKEQKLCLL